MMRAELAMLNIFDVIYAPLYAAMAAPLNQSTRYFAASRYCRHF